jgi:hypothetical protein
MWLNKEYVYMNNKIILQIHWVSGLCPSSNILKTRKHNVSGTGYVYIIR